jgi:hypothetical protein
MFQKFTFLTVKQYGFILGATLHIKHKIRLLFVLGYGHMMSQVWLCFRLHGGCTWLACMFWCRKEQWGWQSDSLSLISNQFWTNIRPTFVVYFATTGWESDVVIQYKWIKQAKKWTLLFTSMIYHWTAISHSVLFAGPSANSNLWQWQVPTHPHVSMFITEVVFVSMFVILFRL